MPVVERSRNYRKERGKRQKIKGKREKWQWQNAGG
jgi:hypothetical protein